jgi:plasmid stability protein
VLDHIAERLRQQAAKHHRSLQEELVAILEENLAEERLLTPADLLAQLRAADLKSPTEAASFIRKDRDARSGR